MVVVREDAMPNEVGFDSSYMVNHLTAVLAQMWSLARHILSFHDKTSKVAITILTSSAIRPGIDISKHCFPSHFIR